MEPVTPRRLWYGVAESMRQLALSGGNQPYGAVLVTAGGLVADGPSRVVRSADPDAHAAEARVSRVFFGPQLNDTGVPRPQTIATTVRRISDARRAAFTMSRQGHRPDDHRARRPRRRRRHGLRLRAPQADEPR